MLALNQQEIYCGVHYVTNTNYKMYEYAKNSCKYADYVSEHVISLPMHMRISYEDVKRITTAIIEFVNQDN